MTGCLLAKLFNGRGRNFERPNGERSIFHNLEIAEVKSYEKSNYLIFIYEIVISFFFF